MHYEYIWKKDQLTKKISIIGETVNGYIKADELTAHTTAQFKDIDLLFIKKSNSFNPHIEVYDKHTSIKIIEIASDGFSASYKIYFEGNIYLWKNNTLMGGNENVVVQTDFTKLEGKILSSTDKPQLILLTTYLSDLKDEYQNILKASVGIILLVIIIFYIM